MRDGWNGNSSNMKTFDLPVDGRGIPIDRTKIAECWERKESG